MVQIEKDTEKIAIHCPMSLGVNEVSEQASEQVSGASKEMNGRVSGPVLQSVFLAVLDHSAMVRACLSYQGETLLLVVPGE